MTPAAVRTARSESRVRSALWWTTLGQIPCSRTQTTNSTQTSRCFLVWPGECVRRIVINHEMFVHKKVHVILFLFNIHDRGTFQCPRDNWNGQLESDQSFAIMNLITIRCNDVCLCVLPPIESYQHHPDLRNLVG